MARKKKKGAKQNATKDAPLTRAAEDELVALQAIYSNPDGEDDEEEAFRIDEDEQGLSIKVVPHPGDAEANFVWAELGIRLNGGYPEKPCTLRVKGTKGLLLTDKRALSKALHRAAAQHAQQEEVCAFDLVEACQEFLRQRNKPSKDEAEEAASVSLWHDMQRRDAPSSGASSDTDDLYGDQAAWGSASAGGLFDTDDPTAAAKPSSAAWAATKPVQCLPATVAPMIRHGVGVSTQGQRLDPAADLAARKDSDAQLASDLGCVADAQQGHASANREQEEEDRRNAEANEPAVGGPLFGVPRSGSQKHLSGSGDRSEPSGSMVGNLISTVRSGIGRVMAALPPALRRSLRDSSAGSSVAGSEEKDEDAAERSHNDIKKDLLLGHLLGLLTEGGEGMPAHALPALAASLADSGVLPRWVQVSLVQQPALFDRAFQRLFSKELARVAAETSAGGPGGASSVGRDPAASWALDHFWQRPSTKAPLPRRPAVPRAGEETSRYLSDFQELRVLGKGGFGLVVAAVNRLDGRQYAIKKIKMPSSAPAVYSRLMREVATLARLQHPYIVRYFQAWCEAGVGAMPMDTDTDTDVGDWLAETSESHSHAVPTPMRQVSFIGLDTVQEASSEGTPTSAATHHGATGSNGATSTVVEDTVESSSGLGFWQKKREQSKTAQTSTTASGELNTAGTQTQTQTTHSRRAAPQQMLYIQMEFCPRTLRQVLDESPVGMDPDDCWQVVRQLLAGLANIHSQGIIHRDLKPANIFYDARGDIKLGDFGLAKFASVPDTEGESGELDAQCASGIRAGAQADSQHGSALAETTGRVGTSFYISPEVANGWARYDDKVDIFSLGIVAFELWHPFATGMERAALLRDLQSHGVMPAEWEAAHPQVARLIRWLTAANPADRPTAREVLRSELLPPTVGDEQLTDLLRSLPDNLDAYERVVDAIFNMPSDLLNQDEVPGTPNSLQVSARNAVVDVIQRVFEVHGAVPMDSTDIGFCPIDAPTDIAAMLSTSGARLAMRYELRAPFAAWLARQAAAGVRSAAFLEAMRRYEVAWVRRRGVGRALPRAYLQADLDIVTLPGSTPSETLLADAEVIRTVSEVMDALPEWSGELEVRLGHRSLLDASLTHAHVPKELRGSALRLLATGLAPSPRSAGARSKHWPSIRVALEGLGLSGNAIAGCKQFLLQVPGEAEAALHRLQAKLVDAPTGARRPSVQVQAALEAVRLVTAHLHAWGLPGAQVVVDPLLRPHADYYSGIVFQVHLVQPETGCSSLLAVGGRYDWLLKSLWPPAMGAAMGAVGVTLNVERLFALAAPQGKRGRSATLQASQAEVLVCAKGGGGLLRERMALAARLWEAGIRAELVHSASPSQTAQYEYAGARAIPWLVTINAATFSTTDTVRVKNLERRTEEDVPYSDVARFLMAALPRFQQREALSRQQLRELAAATHEEPDDRPGFEEMRRGSRKFDRR
ncbi:g1847 [Coccomyxa elongata]